MLYAVVTYANMRGVRAVDRIVDLCQRDLGFIWLTKDRSLSGMFFTSLKGKTDRRSFGGIELPVHMPSGKVKPYHTKRASH